MRGSRVWVGIAVAASVAMLGLAGCGQIGPRGANNGEPDALLSDLSWEAQALEAVGYSTDELGAAVRDDPKADPTAKATKAQDRREKHKRLRFAFGKRMLHGEAVVQTDEGTKIVVVQRGQVTAVSGTSVTVKSADGYTLVWTLGERSVAIKDRQRVDKATIAVGATVGVAGARVGDVTTARLLVITP